MTRNRTMDATNASSNGYSISLAISSSGVLTLGNGGLARAIFDTIKISSDRAFVEEAGSRSTRLPSMIPASH